MTGRRTLSAAVVAGLAMATATASAPGAAFDDPTARVALGVNGSRPDGASTRPTLDAAGRLVAFDSTAANLTLDPNGPIRDVFVRDLPGNRVRLVSVAVGGPGADGPSYDAAISGNGRTVAFTSAATNLVRGDANGVPDVFARVGSGPAMRVSAAPGGGDANGPSSQPDVSADGRRVVFTSTASNLVPGDANGVADVFVADLRTGQVRRVSEPAAGGEADGASGAPAISPDGRFVSFFSAASNLVPGDTNGVGDVFLRDLQTGRVVRVSVSSRGEQQNRSVIAPFEQVSDVTRDGRAVVFDSDATNLVPGDRNRHTDVFVRDLARHRTERVSVGLLGEAADNDSFAPRITPDGRFVAFESFAGNLFPGDARGEDVFVRDRRLGVTSLMSVTSRGRRRGPERVPQLLQRPALSDDAGVVALTSTAPLVHADRDDREDAYVRRTVPPRARIHLRGTAYRLTADAPRTTVFTCRVGSFRGACLRQGSLAFLPRGRYLFRAWAVAPGTLPGRPARARVTR